MKSKREKKAPLAQNDQVLYNIRHSLSHILAMAVLELRPDAKLGVGPVIDNGFYYDFALPKPLTDEDLPKLESTMRRIIAQNLAFEQQFMSRPEADEFFKNQPYKRELIQEKTLDNTGNQSDKVQVYKTGLFIDFCKGGHVGSTSEIPPDAFKLDKVAGAYWKGSEKNDMLTRIYGIAFANKQGLEAFVAQQAEAAKRDHRKLGKDLDLFFFSELVGAGLPLWTPKGTLLRNLLDDFVWQLRKAKGYQKVEIPHLAKKELYQTSGHWDKFGNELMKIQTREEHVFVVKPMNCPHHTQIYANRLRSYRELPQRYSNTTMIYRDEQTGELLGLSRVRSITQDDSHVFCRKPQIKNEVLAIWDIIETFYKAFGFVLKVRLSLHDPEQSQKYLGDEKNWQGAETTLRAIAKNQKVESFEAIGEAAFYGPKVDFMAQDSLWVQSNVLYQC
ncbi:MAG: Threonine-tRNA ligase [Parcubacteria group bacterium GW2011_GWA2_47_8]|nr:MAG: Threonine-tRNA ligase [Parcubacteria group bacterium GW2011_GWA2_47_8]